MVQASRVAMGCWLGTVSALVAAVDGSSSPWWTAPSWCPDGGSRPGRSGQRQPEVCIHGVDDQPGAAHRGDAELGVGLGAERIVDLGDDPLGAERLDRQLGRHDVAVVTLGQGQEDIGVRRAGAPQHVLVRPVAADRSAAEGRPAVDRRRPWSCRGR